MTTETIKQTEALIREILTRCLIDHPDALRIDPRVVPGGCYWTLQTHADDHRKVVGAKGAHIKALTWLIERIGRAHGLNFKTWLKEPPEGDRQPMPPVPPADRYDPRRAAALLVDIVTAFLGRDAVEAGTVIEPRHDGTRTEVPPFALVYTFHMITRDPQAAAALETLAANVGDLFRAYAAKEGVAFALEVDLA